MFVHILLVYKIVLSFMYTWITSVLSPAIYKSPLTPPTIPIILPVFKKYLSSCAECGENNSILTQVSSGPEVILLCNDCYNLKYSKELQSEISYEDEEKS